MTKATTVFLFPLLENFDGRNDSPANRISFRTSRTNLNTKDCLYTGLRVDMHSENRHYGTLHFREAQSENQPHT